MYCLASKDQNGGPKRPVRLEMSPCHSIDSFITNYSLTVIIRTNLFYYLPKGVQMHCIRVDSPKGRGRGGGGGANLLV